jgi:hypothetical protein
MLLCRDDDFLVVPQRKDRRFRNRNSFECGNTRRRFRQLAAGERLTDQILVKPGTPNASDDRLR